MEDNDGAAVSDVFLVHAKHKCGAPVGFLATNVQEAHAEAAKISNEVCPICKLREAVTLTADELETLFEEFLAEENAKAKLN